MASGQLAGDGSCPVWRGLPEASPQPMQCGLLWYVHIGKTGGTSVTAHLRDNAARRNIPFAHLFSADYGHRWKEWNSTAAAERAHSCDHDDWQCRICCIEQVAADWQRVMRELNTQPKPFAIVSQHHSSPGFGEYMLENVLLPLRASLEARGCELVMATVLRHPAQQLVSRFAFQLQNWHSALDCDSYGCHFASFGAALVNEFGPPPADLEQAAYSLITQRANLTQKAAWWSHDDAFRSIFLDDISLQITWSGHGMYHANPRRHYGKVALDAARKFDMVGRTQELGSFLSRIDARLGWGSEHHDKYNPTPPQYKLAMRQALARFSAQHKPGDEDDESIVHGSQMLNDVDLYFEFCASPKPDTSKTGIFTFSFLPPDSAPPGLPPPSMQPA